MHVYTKDRIEKRGVKGGGNARVCFEVRGCLLQEFKVCEDASTFSRRVLDQPFVKHSCAIFSRSMLEEPAAPHSCAT